jgi:3',5'-cyclic AMP phosphodiesterase CpdA
LTVLLQVSDTHFGTERPRVVEALVQLAATLNPQVLLLTGDITQRATRKQFSAARAFVERLNVATVLAIPGNHDVPLFNLAARVLTPYGHYIPSFGSNLEPEYEDKEVLILALNTTRWYRHKDGEISAEQIERVARRCESARSDKYRMVVVHHPMAVTTERDRENVIHGYEPAIRRWASAGVDVVMGGHIHLPFVLPMHERWPELQKPLWVVQAGTAISYRVRPNTANSINVFRVGERVKEMKSMADLVLRHCEVERWDFNEQTERFEAISVHSLPVING